MKELVATYRGHQITHSAEYNEWHIFESGVFVGSQQTEEQARGFVDDCLEDRTVTDEKQIPTTTDPLYDETYKREREQVKAFDDRKVEQIAHALKTCDLENPYFLAMSDAWNEEWERRQRHAINAPRVDRVAVALRDIRENGAGIGYFGQAQHVLDILKAELLPDPWTPPRPETDEYETHWDYPRLTRPNETEQIESQPSVRDEIEAYLRRTTTISIGDAKRHAHKIANICFGEEAA